MTRLLIICTFFCIVVSCYFHEKESPLDEYIGFDDYLNKASCQDSTLGYRLTGKTNLFNTIGRVSLMNDSYLTERFRYCITQKFGWSSTCINVFSEQNEYYGGSISFYGEESAFFKKINISKENGYIIFNLISEYFEEVPEFPCRDSSPSGTGSSFFLVFEAALSNNRNYLHTYGTDDFGDVSELISIVKNFFREEVALMESKHLKED